MVGHSWAYILDKIFTGFWKFELLIHMNFNQNYQLKTSMIYAFMRLANNPSLWFWPIIFVSILRVEFDFECKRYNQTGHNSSVNDNWNTQSWQQCFNIHWLCQMEIWKWKVVQQKKKEPKTGSIKCCQPAAFRLQPQQDLVAFWRIN